MNQEKVISSLLIAALSVIASPIIIKFIMASKTFFDLMEAGDWNNVMELLTNTAWTSQDLEEKHGVRSSSCG